MNTFDEIQESRFYNQKIKVKCIVTGKTIAPYHIPKTIAVRCITKKCDCELQDDHTAEILPSDQAILSFVDIKDAMLPNAIKNALGIRCQKIVFEVLEVQMIERIFIARPTGKERTRKGGGSRPAFIMGTVTLETNSVYDLEGYTTVDPISQSVTQVFIKAEKCSKDVESFHLSKQKHEKLKQFCVSETATMRQIYNHLIALYKTYSHNVTKIYERFDMHLSVDLLFRSVISFNFDNEYVHKGWMEAMIIGDSRCGKGFVAEKLAEYYGLAEVVSGENCSFSGLVGGVQQFNKHWVITWGKIPMNDCGMLIVDETSGILEDIWGKLSRVRSEGVAEITKIQTEVANARTRLLFLCNPPNRTVSYYNYGIMALPDLIKAPEDIARFDYVLVVAHNEVAGEVINQRRELLPAMFDSQAEQDLILWIWSRKPEQVKFTKEAISRVYSHALRLEKMYDNTVPLIQVENVRFKLAKLAIAFAARVYSHTDGGQSVLIKSVHVDCAYGFFELIYGKEQSGYLEFSAMKKSSQEILTPDKLKDLERYFGTWKLQEKELLRCLLINNNIDHNDIFIHLGCRKEEAQECVSRLLKAGCLIKKTGYYIKTPDFTTILKRKLLTKPKFISD